MNKDQRTSTEKPVLICVYLWLILVLRKSYGDKDEDKGGERPG